MLTIISGATGAGKTFLGTKILLKDWYKGENIVTNINMYLSDYKRWFRKPKNPGNYQRFEKHLYGPRRCRSKGLYWPDKDET